MAGAASVHGFIPIGMLGGRPFNGATQQIPITTTYGTSIFNGDLVEVSGDGTLIRATATATGVNVGVFLGCFYTDSVTGPYFRQYWPASQAATDAVGYVVTDPDAIFRVQADGAVAQGLLGQNFACVLSSGGTNGSINTGKSWMALDADSNATNNDLPLRLVGFWRGPKSTVGDAFTDCVVMLNPGQHQFADSQGTGA